jgi:hypothetical protein
MKLLGLKLVIHFLLPYKHVYELSFLKLEEKTW